MGVPLFLLHIFITKQIIMHVCAYVQMCKLQLYCYKSTYPFLDIWLTKEVSTYKFMASNVKRGKLKIPRALNITFDI